MEIYDKFSQYYDEIYSVYDYEAECNHLTEVFNHYCHHTPTSILDLGCGTGTHALALAVRGYYVTGIDMSKNQIESAKKKAEMSEVSEMVDFIHGDMRDFSLNKKFDVAVSLFGSFCYLLEDEDIEMTLKNIYNHLQENGILVFEFWHVGGVNPKSSTGGYHTWTKYEGENHKIIRLNTSTYNHETNTLDLEFDFYVLSDKIVIDTFSESHKLRLFSVGEIRTWLTRLGFDVIGVFETNSFDSIASNSFRPTAIARKAR
jgi:ubiquinone/menaquinone biosynthesis C-methylase UbiE